MRTEFVILILTVFGGGCSTATDFIQQDLEACEQARGRGSLKDVAFHCMNYKIETSPIN